MIDYCIAGIEAFQGKKMPVYVQQFVHAHPDCLILLDESSKIKTSRPCAENKKSIRTRFIKLLGNLPKAQRGILTGTFMSKSPLDAYDQMEFLQPGFWGMNMFEYAERYTVRINIPVGRGRRVLIPEDIWIRIHSSLSKAYAKDQKSYDKSVTRCVTFYGMTDDSILWVREHEVYTPFKHVEDIWQKISGCCMVIHTEDVTDLLHIQNIITVRRKVQLSDAAVKMYRSLVDTGMTKTSYADNSMQLYYQLQDICNGYQPVMAEDGKVRLRKFCDDKMEVLRAILDDMDLGEHQLVIWANRTEFLRDIHRMVKEYTGVMCACLDGQTPRDDVPVIRERFLSGECRIVCANQATGGFGIDWMGGADYAVYMCSDYSTEKWVQSGQRINRLRKDHKTKTAYIVECEGTIDEKITENLYRGVQLIGSGRSDASVFALYTPGTICWDETKTPAF